MKKRAFIIASLFAAGVAVVLSFWATFAIYRNTPTTSDENSYLFQAHCLAEGRFRRPFPELSNALDHSMIVMDEERGWFSRYPPGHALWLTPGVWLGEPRIMVFLAAGLGVFLLCLAGRLMRLPVWMVAIPLLVSPYFINIYGTLLSHTSGFLFVCAMVAAYLAWKKTHRYPYAVLAGLSWAILFLNRSYTAALIAIPFGVDALVLGIRRRNDRATWIGIVLFAAFAVTGILAYSGFNALLTGEASTPTFLFYDPSEGLGFGLRHTRGLPVEHTLATGLSNLKDNIRALDLWLWGLPGTLFLLAILIVPGWDRDRSPLLLGSTLLVWAGYVFFWFPGIEGVGGPVYFFETLPFLVLLAASGLRRVHSRISRLHPQAKWAVPLLLLCLVIPSQAHLAREIPRLRTPRERHRALLDRLRTAPEHSVIFLDNIAFPRLEEVVFNPRGMASDRLLLKSHGSLVNPWLYRHVQDRKPYLFDGSQPGRLIALEWDAPPRRIAWDAADTYRFGGDTVEDDTGNRFRVARPGTRHDALISYGWYLPVLPGRYRAFFELRAHLENARVKLDVAADQGRSILCEAEIDIPTGTNRVHTLEFSFTHPATWVEPRVYYRGGGEVSIGKIGLEEIQ